MPSFAHIEILGHVGREPEQRSTSCEMCEAPFKPQASDVRRGYGRFCSVPCSRLARRLNSDPTGRFMASFRQENGEQRCWEWSGARLPRGYGVIRVHGEQMKAHRYAWQLFCGPIPDGLWVLHRCDNPPCVNPKHLFLGTHADNVADKVAKGRHTKGEQFRQAKLTDAAVHQIRTLRAQGMSIHNIGRRFGIGKSSVSRIVRRQSWRHVI
jgi:hypothetical protein